MPLLGIQQQIDIDAMTPQDRVVFENRLRRWAEKKKLRIVKSRCRTATAPEYGRYRLVNKSGTGSQWMTVEELHVYLTR